MIIRTVYENQRITPVCDPVFHSAAAFASGDLIGGFVPPEEVSIMSNPTQTDDDLPLALALAMGKTAVAAAEEFHINERTVRRKLAVPAFRSLVSDLRNEIVSTALGRMTDNLTRAADVMSSMLDSPDAAIRLRAARAMFTIVIQLRDAVDVADRIRVLQAELAEAKAQEW